MKKLILILMLFVSGVVNAATHPSWLQLKDAPVTDVRSYGADSTGSTDSYAAIKEAVENGGHILIPPGEYLMAAPASFSAISVATDTTIWAYGAMFKAPTTGSAAYSTLLITATADDIKISVYGLSIDGNNNSCGGIFLTTTSSNNTGEIRDCRVVNIKSTSSSSSTNGIAISGMSHAVVVNSYVKTIGRITGGTPGVTGASGIFASADYGEITGNYVEGVISDDLLDSDGVKVFAISAATDVLTRGSFNIRGNTVRNCSGRFVKLQHPNAVVAGNTFRHDGGSVYSSFSGVEAQAGSVVVRDNSYYLGKSPTIGSDYFCFVTTNFQNYEKGMGAVVSGNVVRLDQRVKGLCHNRILGDSVNNSVSVDIENNSFFGEGAETVIRNYITGNNATFPITIRAADNYIEGGFVFYYLSGDSSMDGFGAMNVTNIVTNNVAANVDANSRLFMVGGTAQDQALGKLLVKGNSGWSLNFVYGGEIRLASGTVLPGSNFSYLAASATAPAGISDCPDVASTTYNYSGRQNPVVIKRNASLWWLTTTSGTTSGEIRGMRFGDTIYWTSEYP